MAKTPKLDLTADERQCLRRNKIKTSEIHLWSIDELCAILSVAESRVKELKASAEFQQIPSIGPIFANDLMELGYYSLEELKGKDGASLLDDFERLRGVRMDPCVEDQFRLVVDYSNQGNRNKQWWDFTEDRKQFRERFGYPATRPE